MDQSRPDSTAPDRPTWAPESVPLDRPSVARMYDFHLGGFHNLAVDRQIAAAAVASYPDLPMIMRLNRAFLRRAVQFLVGQGIEQFLDLGSGIPTVGNVHTVAQDANPAARIVYVDNDPVAVAHSEAILRDNPRTGVLQADIREPERILTHPVVQRLLDFRQPLAILLVFVLHFVPDDADATRLVGTLRRAIPTGSFLVISHGTAEAMAQAVEQEQTRLSRQTSHMLKLRTKEQIAAYFEDLELVEPGLVYLPLWRPETPDDLWLNQPKRSAGYAGIGRKV